MIRHFAIACGAMLVLCSVVHGADEYQRVVCIDDPCFGVTLLIKRSATPADEAFVGFELHNRTDRPVRLFGGATRYDFRNVTARPVGMAPEAAGAGVARSMGSGNEHDLLKREGDGAKADVIQPGTIRRMRYVSAYAVGGLGWPPEGGFTVQGRAHFTVSSEDRLHLETPRQGVAFSFEWMPPDEKGMATTRARLKELVEHPKDWLGDSFVLRVLLGNRDVASAVSVEELLAGLRRAEQPVWPILREHIDANYADKEQVLTFWLEVIKARDHLLIRELAESRNVRSVKLIEPLMEWIREDKSPYHPSEFAMKTLVRHRDLMKDRKAISAELGKLAMERCPMVAAGEFPAEPSKAYVWSMEMQRVALTGDESLAPRMAAYLKNTEVVVDARMISAVNSGVSTRACDVAYNTIQDLLGRGGERFVLKTGLAARGMKVDVAEEYARRDKAIAELAKELSERGEAKQ